MFNAIKDGGTTDAILEHFDNEVEKNNFIIKINATHNILTNMKVNELRFDMRMPISKVKDCFEYRFGSPAKN